MVVPSMRRCASLETPQTRVSKANSTLQGRRQSSKKVQDRVELLQKAVLQTNSTHQKQSAAGSTDIPQQLKQRQCQLHATNSKLSSDKLPHSQTTRKRASPSIVQQRSRKQTACSLYLDKSGRGDTSRHTADLSSLGERGSEDTSRHTATQSFLDERGSEEGSEDTSQDTASQSVPDERGSQLSLQDQTTQGDISVHQPSKKRRYTSEATESYPPNNKKRLDDSQTSLRDDLPAAKKPKRSITSYFKPVPRSSSPSTTQSCPISSDAPEPISTPPSSPPRRVDSPIPYPRRSQKRRLTTKPTLPPLTMSSGIYYGRYEEDEDSISFKDAVGDMTDESRAELAEQALDREEARDTILSATLGGALAASSTNTDKSYASTSRARGMTTSSSQHFGTTRGRSLTSSAGPIAMADTPTQPIPIPPRKTSGYKQMYFDTHQKDEWIQCKECDKYYDAGSQKSKAWHKAEHNRRLHAKVAKKEISTVVLAEWASDDQNHRIVIIDCKQLITVRSHAQAALGVTSETLGSIHVDKEELWSMIPDPQSPASKAAAVTVPRFRVFVHYVDDEVVAVVLAERIREGRAYSANDSNGDGSDDGYVLSLPELTFRTKYPAWVSIERVWVRDGHRRKGYATKLVDLVRENFVRGFPLGKNQIAFSWPFENGVAFATRYCAGTFGDAPFLVNADEVRR